MALVRERRQINLRLPELSDRRPRFPLPLPPAPTTTTTSTSAISCNDIEKIHVIGHGNGGTVYKVRHKRTSQIYALKVVHGDSDPLVRRQIYREIEILRRTDSPYIVQCHGSYEKPSGDIVIVMEYMELGTLDSLLQNKIMQRTLDACNSYVGTCAYMSPERFDPDTYGENYDGYAGDIWSLGLTLLELYLGHFPFLPPGQRPDWATLMCAICFGDPPSLPDGASEEFRDFIQCCLQKESSKRWTTSQLLSHPFVCKDPSSDLLSL
ncbi:MITOGEN-ACTIVATED KINASE KINASE KINASE [Salix purpurea]|uniref:mitogen-activated protein kinase kinase n=1 Tax=Salix purpurea TaxID=77065 RepID=A0A9Q1A6Y3_SALPP|nr:MITOGEN-ACTIVATED KINASE KINASE KINASE [Salix purpurea]